MHSLNVTEALELVSKRGKSVTKFAHRWFPWQREKAAVFVFVKAIDAQ